VTQRLRWTVILAALLAVTAAPAATDEEAVRETAQRFMAFYFHDYGRGLPDQAALGKLSSMTTRSFQKTLERARAAEDCHHRKVGDTEPPLVQGDVFTSLFEGATQGTVGNVRIDGRKATVEMNWSYGSELDGVKPVAWTDALLMKQGRRGWRIKDVEHRGDWQFTYHGKLSGLLIGVASQCR
jgi:hypothetical protein